MGPSPFSPKGDYATAHVMHSLYRCGSDKERFLIFKIINTLLVDVCFQICERSQVHSFFFIFLEILLARVAAKLWVHPLRFVYVTLDSNCAYRMVQSQVLVIAKNCFYST